MFDGLMVFIACLFGSEVHMCFACFSVITHVAIFSTKTKWREHTHLKKFSRHIRILRDGDHA